VLGGESFTALAEGLQDALWHLGGAPSGLCRVPEAMIREEFRAEPANLRVVGCAAKRWNPCCGRRPRGRYRQTPSQRRRAIRDPRVRRLRSLPRRTG